MKIQIRGKTTRLNPRKIVGSGGEADVYLLNKKQVVKIFKTPDHPDLLPFPERHNEAKRRLKEHQVKLPAFPKHLPNEVVAPSSLATDVHGKIIGYEMPFLPNAVALASFSKKVNRQNGITNADIVELFLQISAVVDALHKQQVVIGDCNDQNILIAKNKPYLIDSDSFQFGNFPCRVFTEDYVDPLLCDPTNSAPILHQHHNCESDWYALHTILFRCLLLVHPFGGIHKPATPANKIPTRRRSLHRISVFNSDVQYPKPALPLTTLPDELLNHFQAVFENDKRQRLPDNLLRSLRWHRCTTCGMEHSRTSCPSCQKAIPVASKTTIKRGRIEIVQLAKAKGHFVAVDCSGDKCLYLDYDGKSFIREDSTVVFQGELTPDFQFGLSAEQTIVARRNSLIRFKGDQLIQNREVDFSRLGSASFAVNGEHLVFANNGNLYINRPLGDEMLGTVLANQTKIWMGKQRGFGIQIAGGWKRGFLFDARAKGINDQVVLPTYNGGLIDSQCVVGDHLIWLALTVQQNHRNETYLSVFDHHGRQIADQIDVDPHAWPHSVRGAITRGDSLLVPTAEGLVRVDIENGKPYISAKFPDTYGQIDEETRLFSRNNQILAASCNQIVEIRMT